MVLHIASAVAGDRSRYHRRLERSALCSVCGKVDLTSMASLAIIKASTMPSIPSIIIGHAGCTRVVGLRWCSTRLCPFQVT